MKVEIKSGEKIQYIIEEEQLQNSSEEGQDIDSNKDNRETKLVVNLSEDVTAQVAGYEESSSQGVEEETISDNYSHEDDQPLYDDWGQKRVSPSDFNSFGEFLGDIPDNNIEAMHHILALQDIRNFDFERFSKANLGPEGYDESRYGKILTKPFLPKYHITRTVEEVGDIMQEYGEFGNPSIYFQPHLKTRNLFKKEHYPFNSDSVTGESPHSNSIL